MMEEKVSEIERLTRERDKYNFLMSQMLEGKLHLTKPGVNVEQPITDEQKKKNLFLFKYYEKKFEEVERLITIEVCK